jgi:hypothetical protein
LFESRDLAGATEISLAIFTRCCARLEYLKEKFPTIFVCDNNVYDATEENMWELLFE